MLWHTFSQPLGIQFVTACLCGGGVLERFPDLRVALLEGNCSWAPWFLYRLDEHYEWTGWYEAPELTMKPSDYFRRNCWISVEADEETVHALHRHVRRRQAGLLDRLPARRLEVPARGRHVRQAADERRGQGRDREHQLVGPLQDPAGQAGLTACDRRARRHHGGLAHRSSLRATTPERAGPVGRGRADRHRPDRCELPPAPRCRCRSGGASRPTLVAKTAAGDRAAARARRRRATATRSASTPCSATGCRSARPRCWHAEISDDSCSFVLLLDDLAPPRPGVQVRRVQRRPGGRRGAQPRRAARAGVERPVAVRPPRLAQPR